jgi:ankyrin repeat protein
MSKELKAAIEANDADAVRAAAGKVKDLNRKLPGSTTPVLLACKVGADRALEALVKAGAKVKGSDSYEGNHPFVFAAEHGQTAVMSALVRMKQVNDKVIKHAMTDAAMQGREKVLRFIIGEFKPAVGPIVVRLACHSRKPGVIRAAAEGTGAINGTENLADGRGLTPLHSAVGYADLDVIRALVDCGADVNARDAIGRTPLMILAHEMEGMRLDDEESNGVAAMKELARLGADASLVDADGNDVIDHYTFGMLWSREEPDSKVTSAMKKLGAKGSEPTFKLFQAILDKNVPAMRAAIKAGADVNRIPPPHWDATPLVLAAGATEQIVQVLLDAGADVNRADRSTRPLIRAAEQGSLAVVKQLLAAGANLHAIEPERPGDDRDRDNAYSAAEGREKYDVVDHLKSLGAGRPRPPAKWKPIAAGVHHWNDFDEILVRGDVAPVARGLAKLIDATVTPNAYGESFKPGKRAYVVLRPRGLRWCNLIQVAPKPRRFPDMKKVENFCRDLAKASKSSVLSVNYSDTSDAASIRRFEPDGRVSLADDGWDRGILEELVDATGDEAPAWAKQKLKSMGRKPDDDADEPDSSERLQRLAAAEQFAIAILNVDSAAGRPVELTFPGLPSEAFDAVAWVST